MKRRFQVGSSDELDKITADNKEKLVVVDYSTTWCGPCKQVLPKFEALATEYSDAIFIKVKAGRKGRGGVGGGIDAVLRMLTV